MISAGRASNLETGGCIELGRSVRPDSAVAADELTLVGKGMEDMEVEEDLRSPMIVSIFV